MNKIKRFGLIGRNISYSFSKKYFEEKFENLELKNHSYDLIHIDEINQIEDIFAQPNFVGLNITIPYKEQIIPFLDELSEEAQEIGAVNCITLKNGKKTGYNTDVFGFEKTLLTQPNSLKNKVLILGNGGAAKAVKFVLNQHNIPFEVVSRKTEITFENLSKEMVNDHKIIIQCTPVGTFPNTDDCLDFPFEGLTSEHFVIDLIYNPPQTLLLKKASEKGAKTINGQLMLEQQAEKAWKIWNLV